MANGHKTGGGSRRGKKNKHPKAFRDQLRAYCDQLGVDPFHCMADLIANQDVITIAVDTEGTPTTAPAVSLDLKFRAARELAQYLEPKLRSVELTGDPSKPLQHHIAGLAEALERAYGPLSHLSDVE